MKFYSPHIRTAQHFETSAEDMLRAIRGRGPRPASTGSYRAGLPFPSAQQSGTPSGRVIEVLADHDSRYKVPGTKEPVITVKADEVLTLRVTAKKAKNRNREGFIHGFTLLRSKDRKPVPGWDFQLMPGTQEFSVVAPQEPGEYVAICTVICSDDHEGMTLKLVVLP